MQIDVDFTSIPDKDHNCIYLYLTNDVWRTRTANPDVLPMFVSSFRGPWRNISSKCSITRS